MWRARRSGNRTPPRTTDANFDCAFVENTLISIVLQIGRARAPLGPPGWTNKYPILSCIPLSSPPLPFLFPPLSRVVGWSGEVWPLDGRLCALLRLFSGRVVAVLDGLLVVHVRGLGPGGRGLDLVNKDPHASPRVGTRPPPQQALQKQQQRVTS